MSYVAGPTGSGPNGRRLRAGLTLTELLIVLAVISLLVSLGLPAFARTVEMGRSVICKNNLRQAVNILRTRGVEELDVPGASAGAVPSGGHWAGYIASEGGVRLLQCPSDVIPTGVDALKDCYIRQWGYEGSTGGSGTDITNLYDLVSGMPIEDEQVKYQYRGATNDEGGDWYPGFDWVIALNDGQAPDENQALVKVDSCASFLITFDGAYVTFKPLGQHPDEGSWWWNWSDHYLCMGDPYDSNGWEGDVLVRLMGKGYSERNAAVTIFTKASYGLNELLNQLRPRAGQLWLADYSEFLMDLDGLAAHEPLDGRTDNGEFMCRHLGRANMVSVDGAAQSITRDELVAQYDALVNDPGEHRESILEP